MLSTKRFTTIISIFFLMCFCLSANAQSKSYFGEKFEPKNVISYDQLFEQMNSQDSVVTQVEGIVESVCLVKGCWVNLVSSKNSDLEGMFVQFKDYGFFMPLDCAGKKVVLNGKSYREVTSVYELRHYAEDEGKSKEEIEKITEPIVELKFMADGVILFE